MNKKKKYIIPISKIHNMNLEMGYQCNIRCNFCYQEDFSLKNNINSVIWKEKLLPVYPHLEKLTFIGGEPTVIKDASEFSDLIVKEYPHIKLQTITNGIRFDKPWIDKFVFHGHKIIFSLNAGSSEVYKVITKSNNWYKVIENIKTLIKEKEKYSVNLIIEGSFVVVPDNVCDIGRYLELCCDMGFDKSFFVSPAFHQMKDIKRNELLKYLDEARQIKEKHKQHKIVGVDTLLRILFPNPDQEIKDYIQIFDSKEARDTAYYDKVCKYPWRSIYVNHSGDVSVCCAAWLPIGNLYKDSIENIWNSRYAQKFRKKISIQDYSLCKRNCPVNINPSKKRGESLKAMAEKLIYRIRKDPKMAFKKVMKELSR